MGDKFLFRFLSYAAVACGFVSLWISGTFGIAWTAGFIGIALMAWFFEDTRFQLNERVATFLTVAALPLYYVFWRYGIFGSGSNESVLPGILARLILSLSAIKLVQKKSDRDWVFLYVMAFFQILLAAGLSISALYLGVFVVFIFLMVCSTMLFESTRTADNINESKFIRRPAASSDDEIKPFRRLFITSGILIFLIAAIGVPMFFMLPRVGGAGIGGTNNISTSTGFSDSVRLGGIGRIQQNDEVVMRVRVEDGGAVSGQMRWRGIALDRFDGLSWSRRRNAVLDPIVKNDREIVQVDMATDRDSLVVQTFYLEPLDSPVLFGLPKIVGIAGNFPVIFRDSMGSLSINQPRERITYRAVSENILPPVERLRRDNGPYTAPYLRYLQQPDNIDPRISELAEDIILGSYNRYDSAMMIERYLQNEFGYTLEQKAGGADPLSDFLFNVREGHCEYFATAMAIMLRTQGIAARVVNGFQQGEYNETAGVYIVRQFNAHSWVEVYMPQEDVWVTFDPTPAAGRDLTNNSIGIAAKFGQYVEALEMFWIQYFVAYDDQEQRSLFTSVRRGLTEYSENSSDLANGLKEILNEWWQQISGEQGATARMSAIAFGGLVVLIIAIAGFLIFRIGRKIVNLKVWQRVRAMLFGVDEQNVIVFYKQLQDLLSQKGLNRSPNQTPAEFAFATGIPEAVKITDAYNKVRFGEISLSESESAEIEKMLNKLRSNNEISSI